MGYYGDWGYGMMGGWGYGWSWLSGVTIFVWLVVGVLACIWLWQRIRK